MIAVTVTTLLATVAAATGKLGAVSEKVGKTTINSNFILWLVVAHDKASEITSKYTFSHPGMAYYFMWTTWRSSFKYDSVACILVADTDISMAAGLTNADFARIFQKAAATQETPEGKTDDISAPKAEAVNPMQRAAMRRRAMQSGMPTEEEEDNEPRMGLGGSAHATTRPNFAHQSFVRAHEGMEGTKEDSAPPPPPREPLSNVKPTFAWEKHSKAFGSKFLAKLGFKGRLGKEENGVSTTIEVVQRPAQMGIGFGNFTEATALKNNRKLQKEWKGETFDEEEDQKQRKREREALEEDDSLWRKRKAPTGGKTYKRAADVTQEARSKASNKEVILDMRGPDVRVLSNVTDAYDVDPSKLEAAKPKLGDELIYNVRMVVNLAHGHICDLTQQIATDDETLTSMRKEAKMIQNQVEMDALRLMKVDKMMSKSVKLEAAAKASRESHDVGGVLTSLRDIRLEFPQEFEFYNMYQLVASLCIPTLKSLLVASDLLDELQSTDVVQQYRLIQIFLMDLPDASKNAPDSSPVSVFQFIREKKPAVGDELYNYVLEETLWPAMVQCINVQWNVTSEAADAVALFRKFKPHLSSDFEHAWLARLILPRLKKECHRWDPQNQESLIHDWLLPWAPILGEDMDSLYPEIRLALANALNQWHPSDLSVCTLVAPWRSMWGEHDYAKFTHRYVIRKLIRCLHREFEVNPRNQSLAALTWVLAWKEHLPERQFIALFEGEFFPKWLKALRQWVCASPSLGELEKWYSGWKLYFEKHQLANHQRFVVHFHGALVLLQAAASGYALERDVYLETVPELCKMAAKNYQEALVKAKESDINGEDGSSTSDDEVSARKTPRKRKVTSSNAVGLKDVIESMAIANNLTFMPKGLHDGQQVYLFGKHHILIEQGVVFVEEPKGMFKPVDIEQLL